MGNKLKIKKKIGADLVAGEPEIERMLWVCQKLTVTSVLWCCSCCVYNNGYNGTNKQNFEHHVIQGLDEQCAERSDCEGSLVIRPIAFLSYFKVIWVKTVF